MVSRQADVSVYGGGTLYAIHAHTPKARKWIKEHVIAGEWQDRFPELVYVEHRYIEGIVSGMRADKLVVQQ